MRRTRRQQNLTDLRKVLATRFSEQELRDLSFDLEVHYDDLPGEGPSGKARELVTRLRQLGRIADLLDAVKKARPDVFGCDAFEGWEGHSRHASGPAGHSLDQEVIRVPMFGCIVAGKFGPRVAYFHSGFVPLLSGDEDSVSIPRSAVRDTEGVYALRVVGCSMVDAMINDGDEIVLRKQDYAENRDTVAAWLDDRDEVTLKKSSIVTEAGCFSSRPIRLSGRSRYLRDKSRSWARSLGSSANSAHGFDVGGSPGRRYVRALGGEWMPSLVVR